MFHHKSKGLLFGHVYYRLTHGRKGLWGVERILAVSGTGGPPGSLPAAVQYYHHARSMVAHWGRSSAVLLSPSRGLQGAPRALRVAPRWCPAGR
eukprot:491982-Prorocentrum_minimum.AAC.3